MRKKILILIGPQGSGNHIFARLFSMHPQVRGWEELKTNYWVVHSREDFAEFWLYPQLLNKEFFEGSDYFVTSVSIPFNFDGVRYIPKIKEVIEKIKGWGIDISIGIITRDETINTFQQTRIRKNSTLDQAKDYITTEILPLKMPTHFLSLETFFSYKKSYVKYLGKLLDFPVDIDHPDILKFIETSPNEKYIKFVNEYWLDDNSVVGVSLDELNSNTDQNEE